jgi:hypothetical protein
MFSYANYSTRAKAEAALEDMFACGDVTAYEFITITKRTGRWHIMLRGV